MALSDELVAILLCPRARKPLLYFESYNFLLCPESRLKYPVENDIPVLLLEQAQEVSLEECERLVRQARGV